MRTSEGAERREGPRPSAEAEGAAREAGGIAALDEGSAMHAAPSSAAKRAALGKVYSREKLRHALKGPGVGAAAARGGGDMREQTHRGLAWLESGGAEGDGGGEVVGSGADLGALLEDEGEGATGDGGGR